MGCIMPCIFSTTSFFPEECVRAVGTQVWCHSTGIDLPLQSVVLVASFPLITFTFCRETVTPLHGWNMQLFWQARWSKMHGVTQVFETVVCLLIYEMHCHQTQETCLLCMHVWMFNNCEYSVESKVFNIRVDLNLWYSKHLSIHLKWVMALEYLLCLASVERISPRMATRHARSQNAKSYGRTLDGTVCQWVCHSRSTYIYCNRCKQAQTRHPDRCLPGAYGRDTLPGACAGHGTVACMNRRMHIPLYFCGMSGLTAGVALCLTFANLAWHEASTGESRGHMQMCAPFWHLMRSGAGRAVYMPSKCLLKSPLKSMIGSYPTNMSAAHFRWHQFSMAILAEIQYSSIILLKLQCALSFFI